MVCNPEVEQVITKRARIKPNSCPLLVNSREEMVLHIKARRQSPNDRRIEERTLRDQPALAVQVAVCNG